MTASGEEYMGGMPDFLTVEEAARILRIGRTAAYEQTRRFEETDGREGIPIIRVGRLIRVPRAALERWHGAPLNGLEPVSRAPRDETRDAKKRRKPRLDQDGLSFPG